MSFTDSAERMRVGFGRSFLFRACCFSEVIATERIMGDVFRRGQFETHPWHSTCCFLEVMKRLVLTLWGVLAFAMMGQLKATIIFSDNFNAENGGVGVLNYNSFANWSVSGGTVDLIGSPGFFDFFPQNGLYVDLDGTSFLAGTLTSIGIPVTPGSYILSFLLAGSQRGDFNTVHVDVSGGLASSTYSLNSDTPLTMETMSFTVLAPTTINLSFHNEGGDNIGLILDNVNLNRVSGVPDSGSTIVFLAIGMFGLGLMGRKFRRLA